MTGLSDHHTPEFKEKVRILWNEGKSALTIAEELTGGKLSRNAIIGLVNRSRAKAPKGHWRGGEGKPREKRARAGFLSQRAPRPPRTRAEREPSLFVDMPKAIPLVKLLDAFPDECRWIEGDPMDTDGNILDLMCCGRPTELGMSWCSIHKEIVFGAPPPRKGLHRRNWTIKQNQYTT